MKYGITVGLHALAMGVVGTVFAGVMGVAVWFAVQYFHILTGG